MQGKPNVFTVFVSFFFLLAFLAGFSFVADCSLTTGVLGRTDVDSCSEGGFASVGLAFC
jgi:hypothetical protein